jgi:hypothetical protein
VPEVVILVGLIAPQVKPEGTVSVNATVPVKPLTAAIVMVEVAETPTVTAAGEVAVRVKSVIVNVTVVVMTVLPLVPVTVAVSVWAVAELQDSVEVPLVVVLVRVTLVGLSVQVRWPVVATVRATVPVKLFSAATVIVEVPVAPARTVTLVGLAVTENVGALDTVQVAVAVWTSVPLVPVIVTG